MMVKYTWRLNKSSFSCRPGVSSAGRARRSLGAGRGAARAVTSVKARRASGWRAARDSRPSRVSDVMLGLKYIIVVLQWTAFTGDFLLILFRC